MAKWNWFELNILFPLEISEFFSKVWKKLFSAHTFYLFLFWKKNQIFNDFDVFELNSLFFRVVVIWPFECTTSHRVSVKTENQCLSFDTNFLRIEPQERLLWPLGKVDLFIPPLKCSFLSWVPKLSLCQRNTKMARIRRILMIRPLLLFDENMQTT